MPDKPEAVIPTPAVMGQAIAPFCRALEGMIEVFKIAQREVSISFSNGLGDDSCSGGSIAKR
jgi:hypothetical protein